MSSYKQVNWPALFTTNYKDMRPLDKDLVRELDGESRSLDSLLNMGLSFDDNFDGRRVSVVSHITPGTEFSVVHTLGKIITGYIVCGQSAAGSIYDGATTNTKTTAYFKSDVSAVTFRVLLF